MVSQPHWADRNQPASGPVAVPSPDLDRVPDETLVRLLVAGGQDALTVLFDRYHRLVYNVAVRIVRDPGEAEDVVQNVLLDVYRAAANFDPCKGILKVWLLQYAYHRALHRKRHLVSQRFYQTETLEAAVECGASHILTQDFVENAMLTDQMLGKLKSRQRKILEMTYYDGLTAEEIAAALGESVHAVRHDFHRGLKTLRTAMESDHG